MFIGLFEIILFPLFILSFLRILFLAFITNLITNCKAVYHLFCNRDFSPIVKEFNMFFQSLVRILSNSYFFSFSYYYPYCRYDCSIFNHPINISYIRHNQNILHIITIVHLPLLYFKQPLSPHINDHIRHRNNQHQNLLHLKNIPTIYFFILSFQ